MKNYLKFPLPTTASWFRLPERVKALEDAPAPTPFELPYKVYTVILNQSGTNAPVPTVLENTFGGDIVWSYSSTGSYLGTLAGAFTSQKTFFFINSEANYNSGPQLYNQKIREFYRISDGIISLTQVGLNFTAGVFSSVGNENNFSDLFIEIRVYS